MIEDLEKEKLAKQFASSAEPARQALSEEYERLNLLARAKAEKVSSRCKSLVEAWADLLPTLDEMQALLSQRGVDREQQSAGGLPTWTQWLIGFLSESGLGVTVRSVQLHLAKFRGLGKQKNGRSESPRKLSPRDQRRLLAAAQCGNELITALDNGAEYQTLLEEYKRIAMGPAKIEQLLDAIPNEPLPSISPSVKPPAQGVENTIGPVAPCTPESVTVLPRPQVALPKGGNWSALVDYVGDACGDGISVTLAELNPCDMANCLQHFAQKLTDKYCVYDRQGGQIRVKIDYVPTASLWKGQAA
jgi:hypothetical protein